MQILELVLIVLVGGIQVRRHFNFSRLFNGNFFYKLAWRILILLVQRSLNDFFDWNSINVFFAAKLGVRPVEWQHRLCLHRGLPLCGQTVLLNFLCFLCYLTVKMYAFSCNEPCWLHIWHLNRKFAVNNSTKYKIDVIEIHL